MCIRDSGRAFVEAVSVGIDQDAGGLAIDSSDQHLPQVLILLPVSYTHLDVYKRQDHPSQTTHHTVSSRPGVRTQTTEGPYFNGGSKDTGVPPCLLYTSQMLNYHLKKSEAIAEYNTQIAGIEKLISTSVNE